MCLTAPRTLSAVVLVAVLAAYGASAPVPADRAGAEKQLAGVGTQLCGTWAGGPCQGNITLRANRTYSWVGIGPAAIRHDGTWALRGDPARPILVMKRDTADLREREGAMVELKIVRVTPKELVFDPKAFEVSAVERANVFERTDEGPPAP